MIRQGEATRVLKERLTQVALIARFLVARLGYALAGVVLLLPVVGVILLMMWAYNTIQLLSIAAAIVSLAVFFPLLIFSKTRRIGGWGLFWTTAVLVVGFWALTIAITLNVFGPYVLVFGLFLLGAGVVPLSIIGTAWQHDWAGVWTILLRMAFIFVTSLTAKAVLD
jgi:hypothetical protein